MNITNIKRGQTFNNYKKFCEALGEQPKKGTKSKLYHLKDIERYISFHKQPNSQKIIIDNIYKQVLDKERKAREKFSEPIKYVLLQYILERKGNDKKIELVISPNKLLEHLWIVNPNYIAFFYNRDELSNKLEIDINMLNEIYNKTKEKLAYHLKEALNDLDINDYIVFSKDCYQLIYLEDEKYKKKMILSKEESADLQEIQKDILEDIKKEYATSKPKIFDIKSPTKLRFFSITLDRILKERVCAKLSQLYSRNIINYSRPYFINSTKKMIKFALKDEEERLLERAELNKEIIEFLDKGFKKNYLGSNSIKNPKKKEIVHNSDFPIATKKFINTCIDINAESLKRKKQ